MDASQGFDVGLCVLLLAFIGFVSLRFELPYGYGLDVAARHQVTLVAATTSAGDWTPWATAHGAWRAF